MGACLHGHMTHEVSSACMQWCCDYCMHTVCQPQAGNGKQLGRTDLQNALTVTCKLWLIQTLQVLLELHTICLGTSGLRYTPPACMTIYIAAPPLHVQLVMVAQHGQAAGQPRRHCKLPAECVLPPVKGAQGLCVCCQAASNGRWHVTSTALSKV